MKEQDYLKYMRDKGCKITPQRRLIIEILFAGGHKSAEEIFAEIRKRQPNVAFGTVYRNLNTLKELGLIRELDFRDGRSRYEIAGDHHHHLVCLGCGKAIELKICPFQPNIEKTADKYDFTIEGHSFKVYGYCSHCRN